MTQPSPDPYIPDFPGAVVEYDGQPYNLHRHYTDRTGRLWACLNRNDTEPVWTWQPGEPTLTLAELVAERGPLSIKPDPFWDASDEELVAMLRTGDAR